MNQDLLTHLREITAEERALLETGGGIRRERYSSEGEFTVDSGRVIGPGRLMDVSTHTRFAYFPRHRHNYVEIMYVCAGSITHILNGEKTVVLREGDLLFLNQSCRHEILPAGEEDIGVNIIVLPQFFHTAFGMLGKGNSMSDFLLHCLTQEDPAPLSLQFHTAGLLPVQNLIENLIWSAVYHDDPDSRLNQLTMGLLLQQLLRHAERLSTDSAGMDKVVLRALRYIDDHYADASLEEFSRAVHRPLAEISRAVHRETGSTFKELLQKKRFREAAALLQNTSLPVSDVAYAVGYSNTSYFHRRFREIFSVSPREYRESPACDPHK
ncbi:MAG TPA: helix-turn-helix domain-containing protein [Candidatus Caccousia stercoris]|uniref:Helix-turn-helix domain-containing protein n=1 Tax=Candidatus Caccousia stercoris TaxID=2840723 RepID=A0A9D1FUH9_9FIRM|nr:helix-turn-helix domain-containing protein [Candidatus Caccousia stercoris]